MLTAVEMTTKELDTLRAETLAEMGELPPEQSAAEEDAEDEARGPLSWRPRGRWGWHGSAPASLGSDTDGRTFLTLSVATSRPPYLGELNKVTEDSNSRARADALSRLQATAEWTSYLESKGEYASVKNRLDALEKESKDLEAERIKIAARPKNLGKRLVEIQQRQESIGRDKHALNLELQALAPLVSESRRKAQAQANAI